MAMCLDCMGEGYVRCPECSGNDSNCPECGGTGTVKCDMCDGTGQAED